MKHQILIFVFFSSILGANAQHEIGSGFFNYLIKDAIILSDDHLIKGDDEIKDFIDDFVSSYGMTHTYKKNFSKEVNSYLDYEIGEIQFKSDTFSVMFLKKKEDKTRPNIEFLVIYKKVYSANQLSEIDPARKKWMELCNAHRADELVERMYTKDAYYYNRGRLLQGTKSLSKEYSYMNNPAYTLQLTPKHIVFANSSTAYEIGQCSGSYPNPYMLLWKKQANGKWQVLMDSNY